MAYNESIFDILEEKINVLRQETLRKAKNDLQVANELYVIEKATGKRMPSLSQYINSL